MTRKGSSRSLARLMYLGMLSGRAYVGQHVEHGLIGAAVRGTPEGGDSRCDAGERVGPGGPPPIRTVDVDAFCS